MTKPKQILRKSTSIFLVALFFFLMIPLSGILDLTAQAASTGKHDVTVRWRSQWTKPFQVKNNNDGKSYSISGPGTSIYVDGAIAYCLQLGAPAASKQDTQLLEYSQNDKNSYWNKLPREQRDLIAFMQILSRDLGTSGHEKYVYDYARQILVWEITLGYRANTFEYSKNSSAKILFNNINDGEGAADGVNLTTEEIGAAYVEIENRVKEYLKNPTNAEKVGSRRQSRRPDGSHQSPGPNPGQSKRHQD